MTATRWWVRLAARWLARIDGVQGQVQMFGISVTAFSTFSLVLQNAGYGKYVLEVGAIGAVIGLIYTYFYNEGGVRNQVVRDQNDLANNFAVPRDVIDDTLIGLAVYAALTGEEPTEADIERVERVVRGQWEEFRDGINLEVSD